MSLIDITIEEILRRKLTSVAVLSSPLTQRTGLFIDRLKAINVECIGQNADEAHQTEKIIRQIIAGQNKDESMLDNQIMALVKRGAEGVVLGCTELSVLGAKHNANHTIDPLRLVTENIFNN